MTKKNVNFYRQTVIGFSYKIGHAELNSFSRYILLPHDVFENVGFRVAQ